MFYRGISVVMPKRAYLKYAFIGITFLLIWWLLSLLIGRETILCSPFQAFAALGKLSIQLEFWYMTSLSLLRIVTGFVIGCVSAFFLSVLCVKFTKIRNAINVVLKYTYKLPAALLILLLWMLFFPYSGIIPIIVISSIVFVKVWSEVSEGMRLFDPKQFEMAKCFTGRWDTFRYVLFPYLFPFLTAGISAAIPLAWKIGFTAEVICSPEYSIGHAMTKARMSLEPDIVIAWALIVSAISSLFSFTSHCVIKKLRWKSKLKRSPNYSENGFSYPLMFDRIRKSYGSITVLGGVTHTFPNGKVTAITGKRGCGKTTLLTIAAGLDIDDEYIYRMPPTAPGIIFQENRLIPTLTVEENIRFGNRGANTKRILKSLALTEDANRFPDELSPEKQRCVSIGRAIAFDGGIGIFDEPFVGLDPDTKALCAQALFSAYRGKTVLFSTSDYEDAKRYGDEILEL